MPIKKSRTLNDTAALQDTPAYALERSESRTTSVRKIENGYITKESSCKDGLYECSENYSLNPPDLGEDVSENKLKGAIDYMRREGTV